ncbi:hypothetical protein F4779DRAFT_118643 [Xylariaceae sp. FL0662B]|nr:hypothetical protein F4779DRAFT_118643 [Xylariaceae sp. FL0662B]
MIDNHNDLRGYKLPDEGETFVKYLIDCSKCFIWLTDNFGASRENYISYIISGYRVLIRHFKKCLSYVEEECEYLCPFEPDEDVNAMETIGKLVEEPGRPPMWLRILRKGLRLGLEKLRKYIKILFRDNRDLIYMSLLLYLRSKMTTGGFPVYFYGWQEDLDFDMSDRAIYDEAVQCLKKVYKPYWERYDQMNSSSSRPAAQPSNFTEMMLDMSSPTKNQPTAQDADKLWEDGMHSPVFIFYLVINFILIIDGYFMTERLD